MIMETVPTKIPSKIKEEMQHIVDEGWYANNSEFIRDAIREKISRIKLEQMEAFLREDIEWGLHGN